MENRTVILLFFVLFGVFSLSAQSGEVRIEQISFHFIGKQRTQEFSIRAYLDIDEGDSFSCYEELVQVLNEQKSMLLNTRYYKNVEYEILLSEDLETCRILFTLEDGWTILPKPFMLPNSEVGVSGWSAGLGLEYDNFFGTMTDFSLDAVANIAFGESLRLKMWEISPQLDDIKVGPVIFNAAFSQEFNTVSVTKPELEESLQLQQHYSHYSSNMVFSTFFHIGGNWTYFISPRFGFNYKYDYHDAFEGVIAQDNGSVEEIPFYFSLVNGLEISRLDWIQSFRKGYFLSLKNTLSLIQVVNESSSVDQLRFVPDLSLEARVYVPFLSILNYYGKAEVFLSINNFVPELGERLRGVKNSSMSGDLAFFWLNTIAVEVWGNETLHIQLHPFIDMGIALNRKETNAFSEKFRIGFGSEFILMVGSVDLKGKYGYDPVSKYHDFNFMIGLTY